MIDIIFYGRCGEGMNFSWKVFFSTIIMMLITFSVGGYLLITALFQSVYNREIDSAKEENKIIQYSFATALSAISGGENTIKENVIIDISKTMAKNIRGDDTQIRVSNQNFEKLYESNKMEFGTALLGKISANTRGYTILKDEKGYYIQTACILIVSKQKYYLESFRDITSLYEEREEQFNVYKKILFVLIIVNGLISYLISLWITYPIKKVSRVAHKISNGSLHERVRINSKDEIGRLAQDFNRMTDSLENKINELQDITHRQEDFIGSFAHELKTPLTSIIGYADIIRSQKLSPEMTVMSANYIVKEGNRLGALSLKLLEMIVMQKQEMELKKVNVRQLLEEVKGLIYPILIKENITFQVMLEDAVLLLEPDLIKTVIINLIDNGKKAIDGIGTITIRGKKENGGYSIYIQDSGKGIPKEELSRITDAFYMVDKSRAREQGGAGLGLAICAEIIKRHHGKMEFDSIDGEGTIVHLFLKDGEV
jgi:signal transduction histidine kinase